MGYHVDLVESRGIDTIIYDERYSRCPSGGKVHEMTSIESTSGLEFLRTPIDSQRGFVWNRDQVRGLLDSLYRRHSVGGILMWVTEVKSVKHRGDGPIAAGIVKLLLDGQQKMTTLYGVVRGKLCRF